MIINRKMHIYGNLEIIEAKSDSYGIGTIDTQAKHCLIYPLKPQFLMLGDHIVDLSLKCLLYLMFYKKNFECNMYTLSHNFSTDAILFSPIEDILDVSSGNDILEM